jgi:hypothetical protein
MRFRTTLLLHGKSATGFAIPPEVIESFGTSKKPPVKVTINGYTYRSTVAVMGGQFLCGVAAEHRGPAGVKAGDEVEIDLELDTEKREVQIAPDFAEALAADPIAKARFEKLSYSHKREHASAIEAAKAPETRARRIANAITKLRAG